MRFSAKIFKCFVYYCKLDLVVTLCSGQNPPRVVAPIEEEVTLCCRSQWPRGLRRRSAAARLLRSWVRIPPGAWIFVCCECRVLSGRGLCDELITRPEESYRLCCAVVCDIETSRMGAPCIYDISRLRVKWNLNRNCEVICYLYSTLERRAFSEDIFQWKLHRNKQEVLYSVFSIMRGSGEASGERLVEKHGKPTTNTVELGCYVIKGREYCHYAGAL